MSHDREKLLKAIEAMDLMTKRGYAFHISLWSAKEDGPEYWCVAKTPTAHDTGHYVGRQLHDVITKAIAAVIEITD
jgi:hypothetical protein